MSKQKVGEFFQAASQDEMLAEKLKLATITSSIIDIAYENGYEFTEQELLEFKREQLQSAWGQVEELSDEQLEAVAGGGSIDIPFTRECDIVFTKDTGYQPQCPDPDTLWCTLKC